ncbi:unnamed protein product [Alopecurus aequalis]
MSRFGLNIDLDDVARRLSFSGDSPPKMPPRKPQLPPRPPGTTTRGRFIVTVEPREQQAAATQGPAPPPPWASSPSQASAPPPPWASSPSQAPAPPPPRVSSPSQAPFPAPHTAPCQRPLMSLPPVSRPPVHREIVPVSPAPSGSPSQAQQQRLAAELGKLEQNRQAGLQQAWMAAQQQQALASAFQRQGGSPQQAVAAAAAALAELEQGRLPGPQQALAQPYPEQQLRLYTVEGEPAGYKTKWQELHPVSQQLLLQIEDKIREDRHEREQLDQCCRLYEPSAWNKRFEQDARQITQEIGSISTIMDSEKASIQSLMDAVKQNMFTVEFAIGSYVKLRPWFVSRGAPTDFSQPLTVGSYHGSVRRPSLFMQNLVDRFEKQLEECCNLIGELEQLVQMENNKIYPPSLESLPRVMSNTHDYFMYVASKVENLHQCAETIRIHHLNDLRSSGRNDPFAEVDRKEAAKQEAAARTFHPSLRTGDTGSRRQMCN